MVSSFTGMTGSFAGSREPGDRYRVQRGELAGAIEVMTGHGDHCRIVGAIGERRYEDVPAFPGAQFGEPGAESAVGRNTTGYSHACQLQIMHGAPCLGQQVVDDRALKRGTKIIPMLGGEGRVLRSAFAHQTEECGLYSAEAEVQPGYRRHGQDMALRLPIASISVDQWAGWIGETEDLAPLIERFPRSVIKRLTKDPHVQRRAYKYQLRMPSAYREVKEGESGYRPIVAITYEVRQHMGLDVVNGQEWNV